MIGPKQNREVLRWLRHNSKRPQAAAELWALLFTAIRSDTGEVVLTRDDIADELGIAPGNVSRIISELESIDAVMRRRDGRRVRYFVNPRAATHLAGAERDKAQADAPEIDPRQLDMVTLLDDYRAAKERA